MMDERDKKWLMADFESSLKANVNIVHVTTRASFRAGRHHLVESSPVQVPVFGKRNNGEARLRDRTHPCPKVINSRQQVGKYTVHRLRNDQTIIFRRQNLRTRSQLTGLVPVIDRNIKHSN
jgi:hypothetical protein